MTTSVLTAAGREVQEIEWRDDVDEVLECVAVHDVTHDVRSFVLRPTLPTKLRFQPGQHLTLTVDLGGQQVSRCYTISSSPLRPEALTITVKRVPGGPVSNWLHDHLRPGDRVSVDGPLGGFSTVRPPGWEVPLPLRGQWHHPVDVDAAHHPRRATAASTSSSSTTRGRLPTSSSGTSFGSSRPSTRVYACWSCARTTRPTNDGQVRAAELALSMLLDVAPDLRRPRGVHLWPAALHGCRPRCARAGWREAAPVPRGVVRPARTGSLAHSTASDIHRSGVLRRAAAERTNHHLRPGHDAAGRGSAIRHQPALFMPGRHVRHLQDHPRRRPRRDGSRRRHPASGDRGAEDPALLLHAVRRPRPRRLDMGDTRRRGSREGGPARENCQHRGLVRISTDSGHVGWGETCPVGPTYQPHQAGGARPH